MWKSSDNSLGTSFHCHLRIPPLPPQSTLYLLSPSASPSSSSFKTNHHHHWLDRLDTMIVWWSTADLDLNTAWDLGLNLQREDHQGGALPHDCLGSWWSVFARQWMGWSRIDLNVLGWGNKLAMSTCFAPPICHSKSIRTSHPPNHQWGLQTPWPCPSLTRHCPYFFFIVHCMKIIKATVTNVWKKKRHKFYAWSEPCCVLYNNNYQVLSQPCGDSFI